MVKQIHCSCCDRRLFDVEGKANGAVLIKCKHSGKIQRVVFDGDEITVKIIPRSLMRKMNYARKRGCVRCSSRLFDIEKGSRGIIHIKCQKCKKTQRINMAEYKPNIKYRIS